jgi:hypothetical protein
MELIQILINFITGLVYIFIDVIEHVLTFIVNLLRLIS